ncbi:C39 family peptidase [Neobacillus sp. YX16]|uniref:C39 family peptidase n=1 Tax=Neobacillus sp. YX16 TaxID=3047874 RepID=UPI0024C389A5|nr:C39 family peptidase [Neobacillus sp. YX16]WHZ05081.1 C39 family peptidase [Neobacillus sp. YX16]
MKLKVLILILAMGILIGVNYAEAQKSDSEPTTEISDEIEETNLEEQTTISDTNSNVLSTDNTVPSTDQAQIVSQVQDGKIVDVPHIQQMPELPRGCEVTSLAMLLQYASVSVDKMTLASEITTIPFRDSNGLRGNPNDGFVGDIYSFDNPGYGVYHAPIAALAETYLPGRIIDLTGGSIESVYNMIDNGSPVWVITNSRFSQLPESEFTTWQTSSGEIQITYREHSVLVVGYDENNVYINDPLADQPYTAVSRDSFEDSWIQMGKQAISYQ